MKEELQRKQTELLRILFNYSIKEKIFDKEAINKIYNIILEALYVDEENLKGILITKDSNIDALYRHQDKEILLNIEKIILTLKDEPKKLKLDDIQIYFYYNIQILLSIFHEIEHAKQLSITSSNGVYPRILFFGKTLGGANLENMSREEKISYVNDLYTKTYRYNPCERGAYIESAGKIKKLVNEESYIDKNIINYLNYLQIHNQLVGYTKENKRLVSPTEIFFRMINQETIWEIMPFYKDNDKVMISDIKRNYVLEERLKYGIPISQMEYKYKSLEEEIAKRKVLRR